MFRGSASLVMVALCAVGCSAAPDDHVDVVDDALSRSAKIDCRTPARADEDAASAPHVVFRGEIDRAYRLGDELLEIANVNAYAGQSGKIAKFASIGRVGHNVPFSADMRWSAFDLGANGIGATDESFTGVALALVLPKALGDEDVTDRDTDENGWVAFNALIASKTRADASGPTSFFPARCIVEPQVSRNKDPLRCESRTNVAEGPSFALTAEIPGGIKSGVELTALRNVKASAAQRKPVVTPSVAKDATYKPRTSPDRNRFMLGNLPATDERFDGIAHAVIFPKTVDPKAKAFDAWVVSSTDSYHDGIMSYFPMQCSVTK